MFASTRGVYVLLNLYTALPVVIKLVWGPQDGVYLMNIPRTVDHILLPTAGRAEFVIKCSAELSSVRDVHRAGEYNKYINCLFLIFHIGFCLHYSAILRTCT
jgi:hypothetical protein